jgi:S-formylglutathione hydrolase
MQFSVFVPSQAEIGPVPVVTYLSGLTCTEETFMIKGGAQRIAAELGLMLVAPDTSPRGDGVPDDPNGDYDFGLGAGFYLNATAAPWSEHYHMYDYVTQELQDLVFGSFPGDRARQGITGHSMGGHGALTVGLKNPDTYRSISAFAPICSPINCPWGQKALSNYLGDDQSSWAEYDATAVVRQLDYIPANTILVDQGLADNFLQQELNPQLFEAACEERGVSLELRRHDGYDHGYYFISTFMDDHLRHHAGILLAD